MRDNASSVREDILRRAESLHTPDVAAIAAKLVLEVDLIESTKISALEKEAVAIEAVIVSAAKICEDAAAALAGPTSRAQLSAAAREIKKRLAALPPIPVAPFEPIAIGMSSPSAEDVLGRVIAPRALAAADIAASRRAPYIRTGRLARLFSLELKSSYPAESTLDAGVGATLLATHVSVNVVLVGVPAARSDRSVATSLPARTSLRVTLSPVLGLGRRRVDVLVSVPLATPAGCTVEVSSVSFAGAPLPIVIPGPPSTPIVDGGMRAPLRLAQATSSFPCSPCVSELGTLFAVATERRSLAVFGPDGSSRAGIPTHASGVSTMACASAFADALGILLVAEDDATDSRVYAFATGDADLGAGARSADPSPCATLLWKTAALGSDVLGLGVLPAQGLAIASLRRTDRLLVLRLADGAVVAEARAGHPEQVAVDAASGTVFVSVGMCAVEAFRWEEGEREDGSDGELVPLGRVGAAGTSSSYRPLAVLPPAPGAGGGGTLVVGTYKTRDVRVISLPDLALLQTLELGGGVKAVTGLAGDPSGRALVVCDGTAADAPVHVLPWPLAADATTGAAT